MGNNPIVLKGYRELVGFYRNMHGAHFPFVIIQSRGGLGKTQIAKRILTPGLIIKGHLTPLKLYARAYQCSLRPDAFFILDDIISLLDNKTNKALLLQLCDSETNRNIQYNSTTPLLAKNKIPEQFQFSNSVVLQANELPTSKKPGDVISAIMTRAVWVVFDPPNDQVLSYARRFFHDEEILGYLETLITEYPQCQLDLRPLDRAARMKAGGYTTIFWQEFLKNELVPSSGIDESIFTSDDGCQWTLEQDAEKRGK